MPHALVFARLRLGLEPRSHLPLHGRGDVRADCLVDAPSRADRIAYQLPRVDADEVIRRQPPTCRHVTCERVAQVASRGNRSLSVELLTMGPYAAAVRLQSDSTQSIGERCCWTIKAPGKTSRIASMAHMWKGVLSTQRSPGDHQSRRRI